ncbi:MAG: class I SAM-dependent methyltransferase [Actinomycetes bacterium]
MSSFTDQSYLLGSQYRDSSNLDARIAVHRLFSTNPIGWYRWYFDHLILPPAAAVLDIGCGPAMFWCDQFQRISQGWQITLADLSPGMTAQAGANLRAAGAANDPRFDLRTADAQSLPFDDQTFDAVLANHMLYHVPDLPRALAEMRRVLRPGGRLFAASNGAGHMKEMGDLLASFASDTSVLSAPELRFGLENGRQQLATHFAQVERFDYEDSLEITEVAPLVAYVLSTRNMLWTADAEPPLDTLTQYFETVLARDGTIHITKSSGLFVAR